jgi:amino acid transporter
MMGVFFVNVSITLMCWLVICFAMPDIPAALADPSLYPFVYILKQSMSITWVTVELTLIVALVLFANVCYLTAVSRDLFAFARDGGTPCPEWVSRVRYPPLSPFRVHADPDDWADPPQIPRPR